MNAIGTLVAAYLRDQFAEHDRPPRWSVLAHELRDDRGRRVFNDTADARAQQQWMTTAEWMVLRDDGLPLPGPRGLRALNRNRDVSPGKAALRRACEHFVTSRAQSVTHERSS